MDFVTKLVKAGWLFDERYLGHVVVGMNARMVALEQMIECIPMGASGEYGHIFVSLLQEVATALVSGETLDWLGFPAIPDQVLKGLHIVMVTIEPTLSPPPTTDIMVTIRFITRMAM